ncbi:MAG: endonuclease/exonuclease/phosphatase family protein [Peptococcaceae bacterium]
MNHVSLKKRTPNPPGLRIFLARIKLIPVIILLLLAIFLAYMTLTDYNPQSAVTLTTGNSQKAILKINAPFTIMTFNIGYAGLDKDQDFFMDGGKMSRSRSREQTLKNLREITGFLVRNIPDIIILQEVDIKASRSFYTDQLACLKKALPDYSWTFGPNYNVQWVPVPLLNPMGSVYSGIATFTGYQTISSTRYQYPGREPWPRQIFDLDRCFVENRIPVENGSELVLINTHLSAFDEGGKIRKQQLTFLQKYITKESAEGNYVIVGGDWNHVLPGTDPKLFATTQNWPFWLRNLPADFIPTGFKWVADKNIPTVRTNGKPYVKGVNFRVVIDGFLVSSNVQVLEVTGHKLEFAYSDHNPVTAVLLLK